MSGRPIALIGLRGSGKSSLAPVLAARLGRGSADLDERLAELAAERGLVESGAGAGRVLAVVGKPLFRQLEVEALGQTLRNERALVLACGGGVVESEGARRLLARSTDAIWLDPPLGVLVGRLRAEPGDRPPLLGLGDAADELVALDRRRRPWFEAVARLRCPTAGPVPELADALVRALRETDGEVSLGIERQRPADHHMSSSETDRESSP